jgi:hypothetical protein
LTDTDLEEIRRRRRDRNRLGLRQRIVVFLTVCAGDQAGVAAHAWIIPVVGALISFLGLPAGLIGNELSIRHGSRTIATLVFLLSALAGGLLGFTAMLPYITVLGLSVIAGFIGRGCWPHSSLQQSCVSAEIVKLLDGTAAAMISV